MPFVFRRSGGLIDHRADAGRRRRFHGAAFVVAIAVMIRAWLLAGGTTTRNPAASKGRAKSPDWTVPSVARRPIAGGAGRIAWIALGLAGMVSGPDGRNANWGLFAAGSVLAALPVLVLFFALQRWIVSGLTSGSVK